MKRFVHRLTNLLHMLPKKAPNDVYSIGGRTSSLGASYEGNGEASSANCFLSTESERSRYAECPEAIVLIVGVKGPYKGKRRLCPVGVLYITFTLASRV